MLNIKLERKKFAPALSVLALLLYFVLIVVMKQSIKMTAFISMFMMLIGAGIVVMCVRIIKDKFEELEQIENDK